MKLLGSISYCNAELRLRQKSQNSLVADVLHEEDIAPFAIETAKKGRTGIVALFAIKQKPAWSMPKQTAWY
jgi:hypothetical protein